MSYCCLVKCSACNKDVHGNDCRVTIPFVFGSESTFTLCSDCLKKETLASMRDRFPLQDAQRKCFFCDVCQKHATTIDTQEVKYANQQVDVCDSCAITLTFSEFLNQLTAIVHRCSL